EAGGSPAITCSVKVAFFVLGCPLSSRTGLPCLSVMGSSYCVGCTTLPFAYGLNVCTTPCDTKSRAKMTARGRRIYRVVRVRSTQKFPMVCAERRGEARAQDAGAPH